MIEWWWELRLAIEKTMENFKVSDAGRVNIQRHNQTNQEEGMRPAQRTS